MQTGHFCKQCGCDISDRANHAQYCLACAKSRARGHRPPPERSTAPVSIEEIVAAAAKAGMSYGKYVQKMGV